MNRKGNKISGLGERLLLAVLGTVALLPLRALYVFSDILFLPVYYVFRYRRKVVRENIESCFPALGKTEKRRIEKKFYRNFTDYVFETLKLLHISDREIEKRMVFNNVELMDDALANGRDVVVYFSHLGNWEWAPSVRLHSRFGDNPDYVFGQIYRPLRNRTFDRLMLRIRNRFGTRNIAKATSLRQFVTFSRENRKFIVGFMSDQKPSHGDPTRIVDFFGRPTAVITGTETLAARFKAAVFYWDMSRTSRGHYRIDVVPMSGDASAEPKDRLTAMYFALLERNISRQPDLWLWTHRRWKTSPVSWDEVSSECRVQRSEPDGQ